MLPEKTVEVFGLTIPYLDYPEVEEREQLEVLSAKAAKENLADSRVKYEALRIFAKNRCNTELPIWRSQAFNDTHRQYFNEHYSDIETVANELLQPFYKEQEIKKARRQAGALKAAGDANALSAIIRAGELTMDPFKRALKQLEEVGSAPN